MPQAQLPQRGIGNPPKKMQGQVSERLSREILLDAWTQASGLAFPIIIASKSYPWSSAVPSSERLHRTRDPKERGA
jgi:hypothetical protein